MKRLPSPFSFASATQYLVLFNLVIYGIQVLLPRPDVNPIQNLSNVDFTIGPCYQGFFSLCIFWFERYFALVSPPIFPDVIWQTFSYMFLHGSLLHIFFNMYVLYQFGNAIEHVWGSKYYLQYYLLCGIGSGITVTLLSLITGDYTVTVGASGAIFGLLLAYGILFPNNMLYFFFVAPIPAKYAVFIFGGLEFFFMITNAMPGISHIGHLGGLLAGFILLRGRSIIRKL